MFYFIYGDTPLPLKYDKIVSEVKAKNPSAPFQVFDASQKEENNFLEAISINSMFSEKEIIILKRTDKISQLEKFLKIVFSYDLSKKYIILTYEEELNEYGKAKNEVSKRVLNLIETYGKTIMGRKSFEKRAVQFYIEKELKISEYESEKLVEIIGDNIYKVKNEIQKIKNFIIGEAFSIEKIAPILSITNEYNLKKEIEIFLKNKVFDDLLITLNENKEYLLFIYLLSEELILLLKLKNLIDIGKINCNISYNNFKDKTYEEIKIYFKTNRGYMKEYPIFLKLNLASQYSKNFLMNTIEKLTKLEYNIKIGKFNEKIGVENFIFRFFDTFVP